jgi:hypothetical protein
MGDWMVSLSRDGMQRIPLAGKRKDAARPKRDRTLNHRRVGQTEATIPRFRRRVSPAGRLADAT